MGECGGEWKRAERVEAIKCSRRSLEEFEAAGNSAKQREAAGRRSLVSLSARRPVPDKHGEIAHDRDTERGFDVVRTVMELDHQPCARPEQCLYQIAYRLPPYGEAEVCGRGVWGVCSMGRGWKKGLVQIGTAVLLFTCNIFHWLKRIG